MKTIITAIAILAIVLSAIHVLAEDITNSLIYGTVTDIDGKPVAYAKVTVSAYSNGRQKKETLYSNKSGNFRSSLRKGQYVNASVIAKGYCAEKYTMTQKDAQFDIVLKPGYTLKGRVVDEKGKPVAWAKVALANSYINGYRNNYNVDLPEDLKTTRSGKDGSFSFAYMPEPEDIRYINASIEITSPGRAPIYKTITKEVYAKEIVIAQPLESRLKCTLYLPGKTGFAPDHTIISVQPENTGGDISYRGQNVAVGKDGSVYITQLPPKKVDICLEPSYNRNNTEPRAWVLPAVMGVEMSVGSTKKLELELVPGALVKGKVIDKDSGKPVVSARLKIQHPGKPEGTYPDFVQTDANGEFAARVVNGQVNISVESILQENTKKVFQPDQESSVKLDLSEGEIKSDVMLQVVMNEPEQRKESQWQVQNKPIPADFEVIPGSYDLTWGPDIDCSRVIYTGSRMNIDVINTLIKKTPDLVSSNASPAAYQIDGNGNDGLLLAMFDESQGTGKGWDRVYLDCNRNGDLSDEKAYPLARDKQNNWLNSDWITVQAFQGPSGSDRAQNPIAIQVQLGNGAKPYSSINRKGGWKGTVDTNIGRVECATIDSNANGDYSDRYVIDGTSFEWQGGGDSAFINTNGASQLVPTEWSKHSVRPYNLSKIGSKYYFVKISPLGNKLTIEPYQGEFGQLLLRSENIGKFKTSAESFSVISDLGYYTGYDCSGPVNMPVGNYKVQRCVTTLKGGNGFTFSCCSNDPLTVNTGKLTELTIKGDLTSSLSIKNNATLMPGIAATITLNTKIGSTAAIDSFHDPHAMPLPVLSFIRNGVVLYSATAQYYFGDTSFVFTIPPQIKPNSYIMEMTLDTKSPLGVITAQQRVIVESNKKD